MPRFDEDNLEVLNTANGNYSYSGVKIAALAGKSTEYTLVTIALDVSGSTHGFENEVNKLLKTVIESCYKNPLQDQLMIRVLSFDSNLNEIHGFKLLSMIDKDNDYPVFPAGSLTSLYDATDNAITATLAYAEDLYDQDYDTNGLVVVLTDGMDMSSVMASPNSIAQSLKNLVVDERKIESLNTILIGINTSECGRYLEKFKDEANLTQYVDGGDVTPESLAKIANFVSQSISSQSQSLGTGGPSQSLTF